MQGRNPVKAGAVRRVPIDQQRIEWLLAKALDLSEGGERVDFMPFAAQEVTQALAEYRIVFEQQAHGKMAQELR